MRVGPHVWHAPLAKHAQRTKQDCVSNATPLLDSSLMRTNVSASCAPPVRSQLQMGAAALIVRWARPAMQQPKKAVASARQALMHQQTRTECRCSIKCQTQIKAAARSVEMERSPMRVGPHVWRALPVVFVQQTTQDCVSSARLMAG
jgi:hypothetical protein